MVSCLKGARQMDRDTALYKLSESWAMFKVGKNGGTEQNGVQILVTHEEWPEILKALHKKEERD